jgi:hypothetical protein
MLDLAAHWHEVDRSKIGSEFSNGHYFFFLYSLSKRCLPTLNRPESIEFLFRFPSGQSNPRVSSRIFGLREEPGKKSSRERYKE